LSYNVNFSWTARDRRWIFYHLYNSETYIYGKNLSEKGWIAQKLLATKFPKSESTKWVKFEFFGKDRFFFNKEESYSHEVFLSICCSLDCLSFKYLPTSSSHSQREKINKQGESTQKWISVCNYIFEANGREKKEKEIKKIYHLKERFRLYKMDYSLNFFSFFSY
jgi:hypothetical protein